MGKKILDWLEKNCQYLAIGLGALFVGYMIYLYVLQPPAKIQLGQETLTAGKVDEYINTNKIVSIRHEPRNRQYRITWDYEGGDIVVYEVAGMRALEQALGIDEREGGGEYGTGL